MVQVHLKLKIDSEGKLVPASALDAGKLEYFYKSLEENAQIDAYLSYSIEDSKTFAQLAKVHALIRTLATETGNSFNDVKLEVKKRAGLWYMTEDDKYEEKSFSDCSKSELSSAIQVCIEMGAFVGCYLS